MRFRTALSLANLAAMVAAFVVLFEFPSYGEIAFYALVAWIFVGFGLMDLPGARATPTGPGASSSGSFPSGGGNPRPSGGTAASPAPIDFCIWCGTPLPAGATVCPSCGQRVAGP